MVVVQFSPAIPYNPHDVILIVVPLFLNRALISHTRAAHSIASEVRP